MNPSNPLDPRPGDWEAALKVIEAAEARHDRLLLVRRAGGIAAAVLLVGLVTWWSLGTVDKEPSATRTAAVEVPVVAEPPAVEGVAAVVSEEAVASTQVAAPGAVEKPDAKSNQADACVRLVADRNGDQSASDDSEENEASSAELRAWEGQEDLDALARRGIPWTPGLQAALQEQELHWKEAMPGRRWSVYAGRERSAWTAGMVLSLCDDERIPALRVGTVWDQRNRQWVALAAPGLFGSQAARGLVSDEAHWVVLGAEWSGHVKGRWGWAANCESQFLVTRLMTPAAFVQSEQLESTGSAVWGTLEEERRLRLRWSLGADWALSERQTVRLAIGGYVHAERQWEHMDYTLGAPRPAGELRATWIWR